MISYDTYENYLNIKGKNLSEVRKHDSAMIMNATFTGDVGYKRVYILNPEQGWIWTDAKYSRHSRQSISADAVDYYLQFRPFEHHSVGTYVFVPDDTSNEIGFVEDMPENPFKDGNFGQIFNQGKLWMIVDRNKEREFVRYMILSCDYDLKWICNYNGQKCIMHCYGVKRTQSDYTAGTWTTYHTGGATTLDTVSPIWLPDTYNLFHSDINKYELDDTRYLQIDQRIALTTNKIFPQVYKITKVNEMEPFGVLKFVGKRDEWNEKRDNRELMICDYYDDNGNQVIDYTHNDDPSEEKTSKIWWAIIYNNEITINDTELIKHLTINKDSYFVAEFSDENVSPQWRITYSDNNVDSTTLSDEEKQKMCDLIKITKHNNTAISIKPSKSKSLIGKLFNLTVQDGNGEYISSILDMEVMSA